MRAATRIAAIALGLLALLPLHYLWRLVRRPSPWPRRFLGWVGCVAGMRVRVIGTPLRRHVLFLANHLSWLDIMVVAGTSGTAFVSKDEIARWPLIGWLASLNNTVFVTRSARGAVKGQADALRTALASGQPVALFPEGTTEGGVDILPFRASLLASLFPPIAGLRVQPVAIDYGAAGHDIAWVGDEPARANALRVLGRRGRTDVALHFLGAIDPATLPDRKALAAAARARIIDALAPSAPRGDPL